MKSIFSKYKPLFEVIILYLLLDFSSSFEWTDNYLKSIFPQLHWNYIGHFLYIEFPILSLFVNKKKITDFGIGIQNIRQNLELGFLFGLFFLIPFVIFYLFNLVQFKLPDFLISTLIFQIFLVGFAEEFLFRGYILTRLNDCFKDRFRLRSIHFGYAVFITSFLFGLFHFFNFSKLFHHDFSLNFLQFFWTFQLSLLWCFIRLKTKSIYPSMISHITANLLIYSMVSVNIYVMAAAALGSLISWLFVIWKFSKC